MEVSNLTKGNTPKEIQKNIFGLLAISGFNCEMSISSVAYQLV